MITGKELVEEYKKTIGQYTYEQRDCIWSIWTIIKAHGGKAKQVGVNWFARHELQNLRPLLDRSQLYDGCAVLKMKQPNDVGYGLPAQYKGDADPTDYCHIGLGTSDGQILDSTRYKNSKGEYVRNGPGISDVTIGKNGWSLIADFNPLYVQTEQQGSGENEMQNVTRYGTVEATSGGTVNLRAQPTLRAAVLAKIPVGARVAIIADTGLWYKVNWGDMHGYMMAKYVLPEGEQGKEDRQDEPKEQGTVTVTLSREAVEYLAERLEGALADAGSGF